MRYLSRSSWSALSLGGLALLANTAVQAASPQAFARHYQPVAPVVGQQAQVVYYRLDTPGAAAGAAHLYVGQQLHASLLPGGYSVFCLAPGRHVLGAYLDDAPFYAGKHSELFAAELKAAKTYFVKVREHGGNAPISVARAEAEKELVGHREQVHVISRATHAQRCREP
jgi:OOP family OmpA-OmpF porin